jgi:hypothetical protein
MVEISSTPKKSDQGNGEGERDEDKQQMQDAKIEIKMSQHHPIHPCHEGNA